MRGTETGSEHFLQFGLAVHIGQDRSLLDGIVVLIKGKGAGDASMVPEAMASLTACLYSSVPASSRHPQHLHTVNHGLGGIVAQRSKAVGVILAVLCLVGILKLGLEPLRSLRRSSCPSAGRSGIALQAIPAVAAQEGNIQADALSLRQDLAHLLVVVGQNTVSGPLPMMLVSWVLKSTSPSE